VVFLPKVFSDTDVIDIWTSVDGGPKSRMHFQLTTECTTVGELTTIIYTITNFLDSNATIFDLIVDDQIFTFDSGINPGSIGTVRFKRKGTFGPALASVAVQCGSVEFEFGSICTAVLTGYSSNFAT
jgi:hypothetical protein